MKNIPRYKRDQFIFISNLTEVTADPANPSTLKRDGYLLSEKYISTDGLERAALVKSRRNLLVSDNGNFSRMSSIAKLFSKEGGEIVDFAEKDLEKLGIIQPRTLEKRKQLIQKISKHCSKIIEELSIEEITTRQLSFDPDYMIGMEDFTIPVLMMCGMLDDIFTPEPKDILAYQLATQRLFSKQYEGAYGSSKQLNKTALFYVLHAFDFESAKIGTQNITPIKKEGIAISFGAPMTSRKWIDHITLGDISINFGEKLPEAYIQSVALSLGVAEGHKKAIPVHVLGLGSPMMVALMGYTLNFSNAISIDSTAPFKDAFAGKLYGSRYAFLKMDMNKVAAYALINNKPYSSKTPFFKNFEKKYPSNWGLLRKELKIHKDSDVKEVISLLENNQDLVQKYIPYFLKLKAGDNPMLDELRMARSGHNFWILRNITVSIRDRMHDKEKLKNWTAYQVNRYAKHASDKWIKAVQQCMNMIDHLQKQ